MTPAGIEPATFRFVVQHLNHCATAVPKMSRTWKNNIIKFGVIFLEMQVAVDKCTVLYQIA